MTAVRAWVRLHQRGLVLAFAIVLPWTWFVVRELGPYVDLLAITLPLWTAAAVLLCCACAAILRRVTVLAVAASFTVFGMVAVLAPWMPDDGGTPQPGVRIVQANLRAAIGEEAETTTFAAILRQSPDVLVVEELNVHVVPFLAQRFPYHAITDLVRRDVNGDVPGVPLNRAFVGVFSRHPLRELGDPTDLTDGMPGLRLEVAAPDAAFVLYALHLPEPSPTGSPSFRSRAHVVHEIVDAVEAESRPVVLAGDLNMSDRESVYRDLSGPLDDATRDGWAGPTSAKSSIVWRLMLLRVDHIMRSPSWCSTGGHRFDIPGSDHRGVAAVVGPCA